MVANIYVDGELAVGANNGSSWGNAYKGAVGLQTAFDAAVAGDIIHITRTFTLVATIDIDQASGTTMQPVRVLGYNYNNGNPIIDGTFATMDANSAVNNCILGNNINCWTMENIEFKNALQDNAYVQIASLNQWIFINCISHHAGLGGVSGSGWGNNAADMWGYTSFVLCKAYSNLDNGIYAYRSNFFGCSAYNNGNHGFGGDYTNFNNCLSYSNADTGFYLGSVEHIISNCVSDGNNRGIYITSTDGPVIIVGCRITNNITSGVAGPPGN